MQTSFNASTIKPVKATRGAIVCNANGKKMQKAVASVLSAGLILAAAPALAVDADTLEDGKGVFISNCAACHTGGNNSVVTEKTLKKDAISQYLEGGLNVAAIKKQVINGKGQMPAWADKLDADEIDAVAEYVFDQASGNKW